MDRDDLQRALARNQAVLLRNLEGVDQEASLVEPPGGGNSINAILGHLLVSRRALLRDFGLVARIDDGLDVYEGLPPTGAPLSVERLVQALRDSEGLLKDALAGVSGERLTDRRDGTTFAEAVDDYFFHETYHAGQIGLLRRVAGLAGTISGPA